MYGVLYLQTVREVNKSKIIWFAIMLNIFSSVSEIGSDCYNNNGKNNNNGRGRLHKTARGTVFDIFLWYVFHFSERFLSTKSLYTLNIRPLSRMSNRFSISSVTVSISRDAFSIFLFSFFNWRFISRSVSPPRIQYINLHWKYTSKSL